MKKKQIKEIIKPIYPSLTEMIKNLQSDIVSHYKAKSNEEKNSIKNWLEVHFQCMNEALSKIDSDEAGAWEYALSILAESRDSHRIILNHLEDVFLTRSRLDSIDQDLTRATNDYEKELLARIAQMKKNILHYETQESEGQKIMRIATEEKSG